MCSQPKASLFNSRNTLSFRQPSFSLSLILLFLLILCTACNLPTAPGRSATVLPAELIATPTALPAPSPTPLPTPTVIGGTLRLWHAWPEGDRAVLTQIIDDFSRRYPDVLFDVLYVPAADLPKRYTEAVRSGGGPTLILGPAEWGTALEAQEVVADLGALASPDLLELINPQALPAGLTHEKLICLPYAQQGVVLFRNRDISTIAAKTFEELILLAQSATQGETIGAVLERSFFYSGGHLLSLGGQWMEESGMPSFNDAHGLAWLELLKAYEQAGPANYLTDQDLELFKQGRVGWIIDGTWNLFELAGVLGANKVAVDPWPRYADQKLAGFLTTEAFFLNPNASPVSQMAALKFIEFFLNSESQRKLIETERIPVTVDSSLISSLSASQIMTDTLVAQAVVALTGDVAYPLNPAIDLYTLHLDQALQAYFSGSLTAEEALRVAAEAIQTDLQERLALTPTAPPSTP